MINYLLQIDVVDFQYSRRAKEGKCCETKKLNDGTVGYSAAYHTSS